MSGKESSVWLPCENFSTSRLSTWWAGQQDAAAQNLPKSDLFGRPICGPHDDDCLWNTETKSRGWRTRCLTAQPEIIE